MQVLRLLAGDNVDSSRFLAKLSLALSLNLRQTILPLIVERKNLSWLNDDEASAKLQEEKFDLTNVPQG